MKRLGLALLALLILTPAAQASRTVGADANGNLHAFLVGTDGAAYQAIGSASNAWSPFAGFGGALVPGPIAVGRNKDGRMEVFARGVDGAIWHASESAPGGTWSAWSSLGGILIGPPDVGTNDDGRLELFAVGTDGFVYHDWEATPSAGTWSGWTRLVGPNVTPVAVAGNAASIRDSFGRVWVFARGADSALHAILQSGPNMGWVNWASLGPTVTGDPVPAINGDGHLEVFERGSDNQLWHTWQAPNPGSPFQPWSEMAGGAWGQPANGMNGDSAQALDASGHVHVFVRATDNALWHVWQTQTGWSKWTSMGGTFGGDPVAGVDHAGAINVLIAGTDGQLYRTYQNGLDPGTGWSPFASLGAPTPPVVVTTPPVTVTPLPTPVVVTPAAKKTRIVVSLAFLYSSGTRSTKFTSLTIKHVPKGATVAASCPKGCASKSFKVKTKKAGTVSLKLLVKKPLKVGTKITVVVSKPGSLSAKKVLTVRARKAPKVKDG